VRHHLLLVDTATRRDLDDGEVIAGVADAIGSLRRLRFLYVLSIADGRATGPEGWSDWKAALVRDLYRKVLLAMSTGEIPARRDVAARAREIEAYEPALAGRALEVLSTLPPSYCESMSVVDAAEDVRLLMSPPESGRPGLRVTDAAEEGDECVTVVVPDRPGALARTAGVLALNRISVRTARAYSTTNVLALQRFVVVRPAGVDWKQVERDLEAAYSGRLALEARLERKAFDYRPPRPVVPEVRILQNESAHSTVIEVRARDALGLLYSITAALGDLDLDIRVAKIDTLGERVVDVFYVRGAARTKLDAAQESEVRRSILHRVGRLFGRPPAE